MRYGEFPQFSRMSAEELDTLLLKARLSARDRTIARLRLIERENYADIAAEVAMDRSAVSIRLRTVIAPHIEKYM